MFSSIKVRIVLSISVVLLLFLGGIYYGGEKLQREFILSYEKQAALEQERLLLSIIRDESDILQSYLKMWLTDENVAPLLEDEPNLEDWGDNIFTMGNQLAVKWHVTGILTYDLDNKLIYTNDTQLKKEKFSYDTKKILEMVTEANDNEKTVTGFLLASDGEPLIANIIPSKDSDGDIAHLHAVMMRFAAVLKRFQGSTGYDSELKAGSFTLKNIDPWPYQPDVHSNRYKNSKNELFLARSLDFSKLLEKDNSLFVTIYPNITTVQKEIDTVKTSMSQFVGAIFFAALLAVFAFVFFLLAPINKILAVIKEAEKGNYKQTVDYHSKSEIGILASSFNDLLKTIEANLAKILEKNRDIQSILSNLKQGILTTDSDLKIHPEYSPFLGSLVEQRDLGGRPLMDTLFPNDSINQDEKDRVETALSMSEDMLSYELNESHLLKSYQLKVRGKTKDIEVDFAPITQADDDDIIEKFLISLRDVTEITKLKKEMANQSQKMTLLNEILNCSLARFCEFTEKTNSSLLELSDATIHFERSTDKDSILRQIYLAYHTIKGNARLLKLSFLVNLVHEAESKVQKMRKDGESHYSQQEIEKDLSEIKGRLLLYQETFEDKIKPILSSSGNTNSQSQDLVNLAKNLDKGLRALQEEESSIAIKTISKAKQDLDKVFLTPVDKAIMEVTSNLPQMAEQLKMATPNLHIKGDDIEILSYESRLLRDVLMHLLSNSLCHGFASLLEQQENGIHLEFSKDNEHLLLNYFDNGAGIDIEKVYEKAKAQGYKEEADSDLEKANLIFETGLSTTEKVSSLSGRGAGMGAVREMLEDKGGSITLVLGKNLEKNRYAVSFKVAFKMTLTHDFNQHKKAS